MKVLFLNHRFVVFAFVGCLISLASKSNDLRGEDGLVIADTRHTAVQMERTAEALKNEIRASFKGSRKYGKLLSVATKIKSRSAGLLRKIDRNSGYLVSHRDVEKIKNLANELAAEYDAAIEYSKMGKGRPVQGSTVMAADQISMLISLSEQLQFSSRTFSGVSPIVVSERPIVPELILDSPLESMVDEAPERPVSSSEERGQTESESKILLEPPMQSVWEK